MMSRNTAVRAFLLPLTAILLLGAPHAKAHVPYLEYVDYSVDRPMELPEPIVKSRAFYSWFHSEDDVDVYAFEVTDPVQVYAQVLVPVCAGYETLLPSFAVVGPGLPLPEMDLPFELPPGYGAWVMENETPWTPRTTFYEPFGDKWYFEGATLDAEATEPGMWYIYYWDPEHTVGDYVAVVGPKEIWDPFDIMRALLYTPMIREGEELHIDCRVCPDVDDRVLQDTDADGVGDVCDNCLETPNPEQVDADTDGYGAACDCQDTDAAVNPGMQERRGDGIDANCRPEGCPGGAVEPGSECDDCFIATAAFGSRMEGKIDVLRDFRDRRLLTSEPGTRFVELYYRHSPPLADAIAEHDGVRALVRVLLMPLVGLASLLV